MERSLFSKQSFMVAFLLAIAIAGTRFHHFNSNLNLPDASLAVFFLAGFFLQPLFFYPLFFAEAALIDLGTFAMGGSDWCFTPAYMFLIPTYGIVWLAGRYYGKREYPFRRAWVFLMFTLLVSLSAAFVISNAGFYFFSGYFGEMNWTEYATSVSKYYPSYVINTFLYVAITLGLYSLLGSKVSNQARRPAGGHATGS